MENCRAFYKPSQLRDKARTLCSLPNTRIAKKSIENLRGAWNSDPEGQKNMATHGDTSYFYGDTPTYGRHTHAQKSVRFGKIWVFLVEEPARTKVGSGNRNNDEPTTRTFVPTISIPHSSCAVSEYPPVYWDGMIELTQHLRLLLVSPTSWLLSNAAAVRCVHFRKTS